VSFKICTERALAGRPKHRSSWTNCLELSITESTQTRKLKD